MEKKSRDERWAEGNNVVWYSPTDNYDDYFQAIRRIGRQGAKGTVIIHRLIARGSIDVVMRLGLETKGKGQSPKGDN